VKVVNAITNAISLLDDVPKLTKLLSELGLMHEKIGFPAKAYSIVGSALNATLESLLGAACDIEVLNEFSLLFNTATNLMLNGYINYKPKRTLTPIKVNHPEMSKTIFNLDLNIKEFENGNQLIDNSIG